MKSHGSVYSRLVQYMEVHPERFMQMYSAQVQSNSLIFYGFEKCH